QSFGPAAGPAALDASERGAPMRWPWFLAAFVAIVAAAAGVYNVNYAAEAALDDLEELRKKRAAAHEAVQVLRVEWAYLNAPHRLQALVKEHRETLGLGRLTPQHYGEAGGVPFPPQTPFDERASAELAANAEGAEPPPLPVPLPPDRPLTEVAARSHE
ncbi:MAG: hypothetical protein AAGI70_15845, partial [Pseudomonadota bacterium]